MSIGLSFANNQYPIGWFTNQNLPCVIYSAGLGAYFLHVMNWNGTARGSQAIEVGVFWFFGQHY